MNPGLILAVVVTALTLPVTIGVLWYAIRTHRQEQRERDVTVEFSIDVSQVREAIRKGDRT